MTDPVFYPRFLDDYLSPLAAMTGAQFQAVYDDVLAVAAEHVHKLVVHFAQYPYPWQRPSWANFTPESAEALQARIHAEIDRRGKHLVLPIIAGQKPWLAAKRGA